MVSGAVAAHAFNPSTQEAEAGRSLRSQPAWSTEHLQGQTGFHVETLSQKHKETRQKDKQIDTQTTHKTEVVKKNITILL